MNRQPKLVIVEGIPGSGKTTTAQMIQTWLRERGKSPLLFLEGDLDHPADYEWTACLNEQEYSKLLDQFPEQQTFLEEQGRLKGSDRFFSYKKLEIEFGESLPATLIQGLARNEIYELPMATFRRVISERWRDFVKQAVAADKVYIFECCFLQNPLTMHLWRNDEPMDEAKRFVGLLAETIKPLNPLLVYLHSGEAGETIRRVAEIRPKKWLQAVIDYHTRQGHGKAMGWQGFEGMVKFYEMRQAIELTLLDELPFPSKLIRHTDWEADQEEVKRSLREKFG